VQELALTVMDSTIIIIIIIIIIVVQEFLKISVSFQTAFAAETRLAEGQWLEEQVNMATLRMFRVGISRPTVSRRGATFCATKNKASM
jgi:hypothetical protein